METLAGVADSGKSSFVGSEIAKSDRPELTAAKIIVSGGRALGSAEKFNEVMLPLADKLGAALGASRSTGAGSARASAHELLHSMETHHHPRNREEVAAKAKAKSALRFA